MRYSITLQELQEDFKSRSKQSIDKAALLKREIDCYEFILEFDHYSIAIYSHLGFKCQDNFSRKFPEYSYLFSDDEVYDIKKEYDVMVHGAIISAPEYNGNINLELHNNEYINVNQGREGKSTGSKAQMCYDYLCWLKSINLKTRKHPEKFYAWYHKIKEAIGQAGHIPSGKKQLIISTGERLYGTKYGFYQAYISFNLQKPASFVKGLTDKDRKKWKKIIVEISGNDNDVKRYLKEFPD